MENNKAKVEEDKAVALYYIKTFSDAVREPFLILSIDLRVIGANKAFYRDFQVSREETENRLVYDLGNQQWDIPELKKLLENLLPKDKVLDDFEVSHEFPKIGPRIMLLNARQLDSTQLILLAIEDVTIKREIEARLANYTKELERDVAGKTKELEIRIDELEKVNKIMVGRELKMVELKGEIAELKAKGGSND